jgi:hypothetical protein
VKLSEKVGLCLTIEMFGVDLSSIWIDFICLEELFSYCVYCLDTGMRVICYKLLQERRILVFIFFFCLKINRNYIKKIEKNGTR